jgi:hypothetical protein
VHFDPHNLRCPELMSFVTVHFWSFCGSNWVYGGFCFMRTENEKGKRVGDTLFHYPGIFLKITIPALAFGTPGPPS